MQRGDKRTLLLHVKHLDGEAGYPLGKGLSESVPAIWSPSSIVNSVPICTINSWDGAEGMGEGRSGAALTQLGF